MYKSDRYDFIFDKEEQLEFESEEDLSSKIVDKRELKKKETELLFSSDGTIAELVCGEDLNESIHTLANVCMSLVKEKIYEDILFLKVTDINGESSYRNIPKLQ